MPLPKPAPGESQKDFMSRCMADDTMVVEYANLQQRLAICYTQFRDSKK